MKRDSKLKIVKAFLTTSSVLTLLAVSSMPAYAVKDEELNNGRNNLKKVQRTNPDISKKNIFDEIKNGRNALNKVAVANPKESEGNKPTEATQIKHNLKKTSASPENTRQKRLVLNGLQNFGGQLKPTKTPAQQAELEEQKKREKENLNTPNLEATLNKIKNEQALEEKKQLEDKRKEQQQSLKNDKRAQDVADKKQQKQVTEKKLEKEKKIAAADAKRKALPAKANLTPEQQQAQIKQIFAVIGNGSAKLNKVDQEAVKKENKEKKAEIAASESNGRTNMLAAITNPDNLKNLKSTKNTPLTPSASVPPPPGGKAPTGDSKNKVAPTSNRQNLLGEIQAGTQLKKATDRELKEKIELSEDNFLAKALGSRRGTIDGSNDDDDGKKARKAEREKLEAAQEKNRLAAQQQQEQAAKIAVEQERSKKSAEIMDKVKISGNGNDLLAAIRKGKTLRKVDTLTTEKKKEAVKDDNLYGAASMADQIKARQAEVEAEAKTQAQKNGVMEEKNDDDWGDDGWNDQPASTPALNKVVETPKPVAEQRKLTKETPPAIAPKVEATTSSEVKADKKEVVKKIPVIAVPIVETVDTGVPPPPPATNVAPPSDISVASFIPAAPVGSPPGDSAVSVATAPTKTVEVPKAAPIPTSIVNPAPEAKTAAVPQAKASPNINRSLPTPPSVKNMIDGINKQNIATKASTKKAEKEKALGELEEKNIIPVAPKINENSGSTNSQVSENISNTRNIDSSKALRITSPVAQELAALRNGNVMQRAKAALEKTAKDKEEAEEAARLKAEEHLRTAVPTPVGSGTPPPPKPPRDHAVATPVTSASTTLPALPARNGTVPALPPRPSVTTTPVVTTAPVPSTTPTPVVTPVTTPVITPAAPVVTTPTTGTTPTVPVITTTPVPSTTPTPVVTPVTTPVITPAAPVVTTPTTGTTPSATPVTTSVVPAVTTPTPGTSSASATPTLVVPGAGPAVTSRPAAPTAFDIELSRVVTASSSEAASTIEVSSTADNTDLSVDSTAENVAAENSGIVEDVDNVSTSTESSEPAPTQAVTSVDTANISTATASTPIVSADEAREPDQQAIARETAETVEPASGGEAGDPPPLLREQAQKAFLQTVEQEGFGRLVNNFKNITSEVAKAGRMALNARTDYLTNFIIAAPAAGDEASDVVFGTWISGLYGASKKANSNSEAGYDGKLAGGSAGLDAEIKDNTIVGASYSYVNSSFKYKGAKSGDKIAARSNIGAVYGISQFSNNIVWRGIASVSFSKIKNTRLTSSNNNKVATAKLNSTNYTIDNNIGYRCDVGNNASVTPNISLRYSNYSSDAYREAGVDDYGLSVGKSSSSDLTGIVGIKLSSITQLDNGTKITPTLNVAIERLLNQKQQKVRAKLNWTNDYFEGRIKTNKLDLTTINLGGNILAQKNNLEFSAGCNYNFSPDMKSQNYQGFAKLKIKL